MVSNGYMARKRYLNAKTQNSEIQSLQSLTPLTNSNVSNTINKNKMISNPYFSQNIPSSHFMDSA